MRRNGLSESACEREFLKYLPSLPFRPYQKDHTPASSQDFTLTALAQLGALRLRTSRCFISLLDKTHQYILAEATPTLSLQSDEVHDQGEELWFGCTVLNRHEGPCSVLVEQRIQACREGIARPDDVSVIPDLSHEDASKDSVFASQTPTPRFYAAVPLQSPRGAIIGSYCVLDDKPRDSLDAAQLQFMKDMATTVMSHLVLSKIREEYRQGERMIRGIGSFVEGKATLRDWRATTGYNELSHELSRRQYKGEGQLDTRQQTLQKQDNFYNSYFPDSRPEAHGSDMSERSLAKIPHMPQYPDGFVPSLDTSETRSTLSICSDFSNMSRPRTSPSTSYTGHRSTSHINTSRTPGSPPLHSSDDSLSLSIPLTFSRAANVIRESLEVEGAVFYDAGINLHHQLIRDSLHTDSSSNEDSQSGSGISDSDASGDALKPTKTCPVLAFSDSQRSSINNETNTRLYSQFPEKFLKSLLQRYPKGKIFHFDPDGNLSSGSSGDETSDPTTPGEVVAQDIGKKKKRSARPRDGEILSKIFPGARSIGMFPLWDNNQEKWHAGGFIWTMQPNRSFTVEGQLSFLNAIGSTIMAEVARLKALTSDRAKTDLLGSISHELRSPLHGILGSVELLEGSPQTTFQTDMIHSIEICGRTLLDTVEQLLDFSKINHLAQRKKQASRHSSTPSALVRSKLGDPATRLDVITEEVVAAVSAGFDAQRRAKSGYSSQNPESTGHDKNLVFTPDGSTGQPWVNYEGVDVILDIDKSMDMAFFTFPGAWRRVVMNLFANALKYTKTGHIKISLSAKPVRRKPAGALYKILLTVIDTGQGISADYLRNRLFKPFSQEDSLASGTGLGLSIVKQIVDTYNGRVAVESVQNIGTKISVSMCMERERPEMPGAQDDPVVLQVANLAQRIHGKTACLLSSVNVTNHSDKDDDEDNQMDASLQKTCHDWFGLTFCKESDNAAQACDIFFAIEPEPQRGVLNLERIQSLRPRSGTSAKPLLVVLCRSMESRQKIMAASQEMLSDNWIVQYITQPYGTQKLAKSISLALDIQMGRVTPQVNVQPRSQGNQASKTRSNTENADTPAATSTGGRNTPQAFSDSFYSSPTNSLISTPHASGTHVASNRPPMPLHSQTQWNIGEATLAEHHKAFQLKDTTYSDTNTFLLVDDNPINLKILAAHMKRRNVPFVTASNGAIALERYTANPAACKTILMDISMPVMDGLMATRAIRQVEKQKKWKPSVIIIVTGLASADVQEETSASGADAYLAKPVRLKELDEVLEGIKKDGEGKEV